MAKKSKRPYSQAAFKQWRNHVVRRVARGESVSAAARAEAVTRQTIYAAMTDHPDFAREIDEAREAWRRTWKAAFCQAYSKLPNVRAALLAAGVKSSVFYDALDDDPEFAEAVDAAREQSEAWLELQLFKRAEIDTKALIFALQHNSTKYRPHNTVRHVGHDGGAVKVRGTTVDLDILASLSDETLEQIEAELNAAEAAAAAAPAGDRDDEGQIEGH